MHLIWPTTITWQNNTLSPAPSRLWGSVPDNSPAGGSHDESLTGDADEGDSTTDPENRHLTNLLFSHRYGEHNSNHADD